MKIGDLFLVVVAGYVIYKVGFVDGWTTINLFILVCLIVAVISTILTRTGVKARMKAKEDAAIKAQEEKKKMDASSEDAGEEPEDDSSREAPDSQKKKDKDKEEPGKSGKKPKDSGRDRK